MVSSSNRLETAFLGFPLRSPCLIGSSFLTGDIRRIKRADLHGAGGVSTKMALLEVPFRAQADVIVLPNGMGIATTGDKRLPVDAACDLIRQVKQECSLMVMANVVGPDVDAEGWQEVATRLAEAGADALELDISCPNMPPQIVEGKLTPPGACIAQFPSLSQRITRAVKDVVNIPVICKLTAVVTSIREVALACEAGGADAITAINGIPGVPPVDIRNGGRAPFMTIREYSPGAICGPAILPIACRAVADIYQTVNLPIIGCGGVMSWRDAVQMIMYGASAVEMVTSIALHGFEIVDEINRGISAFMEEQGYSSIEDFRGLAVRHLRRPEEMEYRDIWLTVRQDRCNKCMRCLRIGQCLAINFSDGAIHLDNEQCIHCGTCRQVCPQQAIEYKERTALV